ncbi:MAG TPA: ATP-binding protein, partial [Thermotogota bacterium]|nr:ATP-binding protein [Thermotogota bacterium]
RIERLLQNKHETFEARHRCKNGSTLELEIAVSVVDSTPPKFVCFSRDISERKRMQAQLLEAKEQAEIASLAKSRFLSNMSHELRTPLNGIAGFSRLLLKTNLDDTQKEYLGYVLSASDVLKDVVGNILDFSKIEAGKMELYEEPVSLQELCSKSLQIFKLQAQQKEILLEMDYEESLPGKILADPVRLQQVLLNLVGNAVKFTAQGEVRLGVSWSQPDDGQNPRSIHFEVKDTGIGISEEAKNKIFNVFEQADNSTTRQFGGSGLGLTIARSLLELMRATLHLESEPGIGSRFFFDLPLKEDPWTES